MYQTTALKYINYQKNQKKSERAKRRNRPTLTVGGFNRQLLVIGRIIK